MEGMPNLTPPPAEQAKPDVEVVQGGKPEAIEIPDDDVEVVAEDLQDETTTLFDKNAGKEEPELSNEELGAILTEATTEDREDPEVVKFEQSDYYRELQRRYGGKTVRVMTDEGVIEDGWKVTDAVLVSSLIPGRQSQVRLKMIKSVEPKIDPKGRNDFKVVYSSSKLLRELNPGL